MLTQEPQDGEQSLADPNFRADVLSGLGYQVTTFQRATSDQPPFFELAAGVTRD